MNLYLKTWRVGVCFCCIGVRSCYDEGKRTAETLTMDYHRGAEVEVYYYSFVYVVGICFCVGKSYC